jgi:hypothetical protein
VLCEKGARVGPRGRIDAKLSVARLYVAVSYVTQSAVRVCEAAAMESGLEPSDGTGSEVQHELRVALEQQGRELLQLAADRAEAVAAQREFKLQRRLQQRSAR